ncbi:MAG: hypothetical protein WD426_16715 [Anditalea sp.]
MKNLNTFPFLFALSAFFVSCFPDDTNEPMIITEPDRLFLMASDTISSGTYMGLLTGEDADKVYAAVTDLGDSIGVTYLNIVSNIFSGLTGLEDRLPLYQSVFLDEKSGTSTGVQIAIEDGRIKSIFLNSGKKLDKWPNNLSSSSAIRTGDKVETLYGKLKAISDNHSYKINLSTFPC